MSGPQPFQNSAPLSRGKPFTVMQKTKVQNLPGGRNDSILYPRRTMDSNAGSTTFPNNMTNDAKHMEDSRKIKVNILVTAPDKDKVYRWLIGRNGTNIKLMQSTGVSIQVDRRLGNICLEGDPVLVDKVSRVINRLAADTASSSVGCGGKKVMTAIRRLISDCSAYHSNNNRFSNRINNRGELRKTPSHGGPKGNPDGGMNSTIFSNRESSSLATKNFISKPEAVQNPQRINYGHQDTRKVESFNQTQHEYTKRAPFKADVMKFERLSGRDIDKTNAQNSVSNPDTERISKMLYVTAPDKDKVYRWLIGRNGTNIKLMQSTGVSIQVDRKAGTVLLEGETILVRKVQTVIERLMQDTASPLVGCGGKKVMTAIKRLIADCASVHARKSNGLGTGALKPRYNKHADNRNTLSTGSFGNISSNSRDPRSRNNSRFGSTSVNMRSGNTTSMLPVNRYAPNGTYRNTMHGQGQDNYVCNIEIAVSTNKREKAYSRLIGRGGNVIRRMERHSGAEIKVDKNQRNVFIQGKKEDVEKARMMVSSILTGVENDELAEDLPFSMPFSTFTNDSIFQPQQQSVQRSRGNNFTNSHSQQPGVTSLKIPSQNVGVAFNRNVQVNNQNVVTMDEKNFNAEKIANVSGLDINDSSSLSSAGFLGLNDTKALAKQQTPSLTGNGWEVQNRNNINNGSSAPFESAHSFHKSGVYEKSLSSDGNSWNSALFDFAATGNVLNNNEVLHGGEHVDFKVTNSRLNASDQLNIIPQAPQAHTSAAPPLANAFSASSWNSLNNNGGQNNEPGSIFFSQSSSTSNEAQWAKLKSDTGVSWN